ncbi:hypothetical protein K490DRAFT_70584 [Saccharata proteae CBS 121410]|uniref:Sin3 binding protein n=1 Tax=Saccharata proteae CBS 121410 TaxID=1314787 RepID=A0A9P4M3G0_9PEZI|nr:hypothetical protein K490DRAFT_70584 [Saccharata proteae CBS 121410]
MAQTAPIKPLSNVTAAFQAHAASVAIPHPFDAIRNEPQPDRQPNMLPTPPNSISPTLPPHKLRASHNAGQTDSDVDLLDAVDHAASTDQPTTTALPLSSAALSGLDAADAITPSALAKHHLPNILLNNGPVAIRHVLLNLAQTVPGFSSIPQAKARRLVVAALESRTGGGPDGQVEFEKIGWGRWDAHIKGQPRKEGALSGALPVQHDGRLAFSPPGSMPDSYAMSHAGGLQIPSVNRRMRDGFSGGSWAEESMLSSRDEAMTDMNMAEHEADKMSLDGYDTASSDSAGGDDDADDATDEEDWAGIGAEELRRGSMAGTGGIMRNYNLLSRSATDHRKRSMQLQQHSPRLMPQHWSSRQASVSKSYDSRSRPSGAFGGANQLSSFGGAGAANLGAQNAQEREAIEALLKMGSM